MLSIHSPAQSFSSCFHVAFHRFTLSIKHSVHATKSLFWICSWVHFVFLMAEPWLNEARAKKQEDSKTWRKHKQHENKKWNGKKERRKQRWLVAENRAVRGQHQPGDCHQNQICLCVYLAPQCRLSEDRDKCHQHCWKTGSLWQVYEYEKLYINNNNERWAKISI